YFAASLWNAFKLFRDRWRITEQRPNSISPSPHSDAPNRILSASEMLPAPKLYPPLWHDEDRGGEIAFIVFDEALAWLRKHFSEIAVTVVYLPSPAAVYRYPEPVIATGDSRRALQSAAAIYADSQRICEHIRMLS